jgi:predicted ATPase/class 3 adenylate cyclase
VTELPSGTVTFLFTDVEGSTRLWEEFPQPMQQALARHDQILRDAIESGGGSVVKTTGDGFHAVFPTAHGALETAVGIQRALAAEPFTETGPLLVRMGVHTCEAQHREGDYYGSEVNRAARLMSVAHGGQILVSLVTCGLVRDGSVELADLGEHRLRDLTDVERVFEVRAQGLASGFAPVRSLDALPGNLPRQATTFVGREAEIASLASLVRESPFVTLTGVGGVGKTRLSLQVAAEVLPDLPDGAWFCEYAPLADPGAVWDTLAASLRVQGFPGRSLEESVLEFLAGKRLLLVLDNCEHLLDALARLVDAIARRAPRVSVLATSREGLGSAGERIVAVRSLSVPADDVDVDDVLHAEAVLLFADRATAANSGFALTAQNAETIGLLCRRLDGIPLAIELAAARARSMSPEDLVARLDQRFKLLTRGSRGARERQQTLRSTIDWSYDLLEPIERKAMNRLSVFAGGCDLAAAEVVLADDELDAFDVDDVLGQLVDKSLVVADHRGVSLRYRMLETIRQYADEHLQEDGDTDSVRRRHADYYVSFSEAAGAYLVGPHQVEWSRTLLCDADNLRAALDWAVEAPSPEHALRLVAPLAHEGSIGDAAKEWAPVAIAIPGAEDDALFPAVAAWAAWSAALAGEFERADELIATGERARAALHAPPAPLARARAVLALTRRDYELCREASEELVDVARDSGDIKLFAQGLTLLGSVLGMTGATEAAITTLEEAVHVSREHGMLSNLAYTLMTLARILPVDESRRAYALIDEAVEVAAPIGGSVAATVGATRNWFLAGTGDWPTALRASVAAAEELLQLGAVASMDRPFQEAGLALARLGHPEPAAVLLMGVANARADGPQVAPLWALDLCDAARGALLETLGEQQVAMLTSRGSALSAADAVAYLRAEADRALAAP